MWHSYGMKKVLADNFRKKILSKYLNLPQYYIIEWDCFVSSWLLLCDIARISRKLWQIYYSKFFQTERDVWLTIPQTIIMSDNSTVTPYSSIESLLVREINTFDVQGMEGGGRSHISIASYPMRMALLGLIVTTPSLNLLADFRRTQCSKDKGKGYWVTTEDAIIRDYCWEYWFWICIHDLCDAIRWRSGWSEFEWRFLDWIIYRVFWTWNIKILFEINPIHSKFKHKIRLIRGSCL